MGTGFFASRRSIGSTGVWILPSLFLFTYIPFLGNEFELEEKVALSFSHWKRKEKSKRKGHSSLSYLYYRVLLQIWPMIFYRKPKHLEQRNELRGRHVILLNTTDQPR